MKKTHGKLSLSKMTISNLSASEMNSRFGGGARVTTGNPCKTDIQGGDCGTFKTFTDCGTCKILTTIVH